MTTETAPSPKTVTSGDLEVKDAQLIFNSVWDALETEFSREELTFPREIFWINGAPGAGKGTHTRTAMRLRDLTAPPIVMSSLLSSPEAKALINKGLLVGDKEVISILLRKLLEPVYQTGAVVDGFPRTKVQVETLKLLHKKLLELRDEFRNTLYAPRFRKPQFHILVLFVDEAESIRRQLERGKLAEKHNEEVAQSGIGEPMEIRATDTDENAARKRYRVFKEQTYEALKSLREAFHFHFVNTHHTIEETRAQIINELKYQSSLELEQDTHDVVARLPLASDLAKNARQQLVERLDSYEQHQRELFHSVIDLIEDKFIPIILRHAISGRAVVNSEDTLFHNPDAIAMLIDIFSERGYHATVNVRLEEIADTIDPKTFKIGTRVKRVCRCIIDFPGSDIRRGG